MEQAMNAVRDIVEKKLGSGYTVSVREQTKNNGVLRHGLVVADSANPTVCPVMYIDEYLDEIRAGRMQPSEVADAVLIKYRAGSMFQPAGAESFRIDNKQQILSRVVYRLVNTEMNFAELAEVPHRDFLDLSVEYRMLFDFWRASAKVSWKMCDALGITESELDAAAEVNTAQYGFDATPMPELFAELTGGSPCETGPIPMTVYTNEERVFGASVMLYPDEFRAFAEKVREDLYILPSSVHEVLAIPVSPMTKDDLRRMVGEINRDVVDAEEVLSQNIYRYSLETGKITIA